MKKNILLAALLAAFFLFGGNALAAERGGFKGPGLPLTTVAQAKKMQDDEPVALRGNIVRHLGKDEYEFKDASGSVILEIDADEWGGATVTPSDTVEVYGKVDRDRKGLKIDVGRIAKMQ